ncbi:amino acid permease [Microvirga thermotolerans]|uniref:Amino acid permease n=1 Tax=Microvirga thermotolerans TaxID=2651334 RepID=A0A5P9JTY0_9HYPH|nr:amino acid permease [Microvirga thermotolerans]QFU15571.1 amino acid permease [Microvirga thermotolerans]
MSVGQGSGGVHAPPAGAQNAAGVTYTVVDESYFEARRLKRHARVWSLWALGVGAVISGHYSGWNLGLANGFGSMFFATVIIAVMYLGLTFSIAEMSPALPHTGGAYSFARTSMGPWAGYVTGIAENIEFVLTPAVIVFFIGSYLSGIFGTEPAYQPVYWIVCYAIFVGLNIVGVELSFKVTVTVTLLALACLVVFYVSVLVSGKYDFARWALNMGPGGVELPNGNGPFLPMGIGGIFATMPFAVWLFLAIEQLPLAAEESHDPQKDMPKGIIAGILTLIASAFCVIFLNTGIAPGATGYAKSTEPLLDGFRTLFGSDIAKILAAIAVIGLIASFHTIIFAFGRQIYSLSRAGYFPSFLSITHGQRKTPHVALITGALVGLLVMMVIWFSLGADAGGSVIGGTLLNMAVAGAMLAYFMQGMSYIVLKKKFAHLHRPYVSPFGVWGAITCMVIAAVTLYFQFTDPVFQTAVMGVAVYYAVMMAYFLVHGRHKLILSPEEEFAVSKGAAEYRSY